MLALRISQQWGSLHFATGRGGLSYQTSQANLDNESQRASLDVRQPQGTLEIDSQPCRSSYGMKSQEEFRQDNVSRAKENVSEDIGRIVDEGNRMAQIENHQCAAADIATWDFITPPYEVELTSMAPPEINYQANPPDIQFVPGGPDVRITAQPPAVDYHPPSVDIEVQQYPSVQYSVVDISA